MAKLMITMDGQLLSEFELDKERITIGRKPHNDIPIDNLAISGEHAAITTILNDAFVEDLGSTNGTLVNSQPITKHALHHGDEIEHRQVPPEVCQRPGTRQQDRSPRKRGARI